MAASSSTSIVPSDHFSQLMKPPKEDAINNLSDEILMKVLGFLPWKSCCNASKVCRRWNSIAIDVMPLAIYMKTFYPKLDVRVIDETFWNQYDDTPGLPKMSEKILLLDEKRKICERISAEMEKVSCKIEGCAGATLLTMPPISLKTLRTIGKAINNGDNPIGLIGGLIDRFFGDECSKEPERLLIANNILEGSRNKTAEEQFALVEETGWEVPCIRHIAALALATFASSRVITYPRQLNINSIKTFARSLESKEEPDVGVIHPSIGGFGRRGFSFGMDSLNSDTIGIAFALRNF